VSKETAGETPKNVDTLFLEREKDVAKRLFSLTCATNAKLSIESAYAEFCFICTLRVFFYKVNKMNAGHGSRAV
jgi:hypothetical protein